MIDPRQQAAHAARMRGELQTARTLYAAVLRDYPDNADAAHDLGQTLSMLREDNAAAMVTQVAVRLDPTRWQVWNNLANSYWRLRNYPMAQAAFEEARRLGGNDPGLMHNIGLCQYSQGEHAAAIESYDTALAANPNNPGLWSDRALAILASGDWKRGWVANEARWGMLAKSAAWYTGAPEWQGENLAGKSILVHHEQGNGDTIQFCRFVTHIRLLGAYVTLAVPASLMGFVEGLGLSVLPGTPSNSWSIIDIDGKMPHRDYHAPLLSLPRHLKIDTNGHISGKPYLNAARPYRASDAFNVGICWAGRGGLSADLDRSASISDFWPLTTLRGVKLFSLVKGPREADIRAAGLDGFVTDLAPKMHDYAATARLINGLDLVVTVDTSVAHVAGAIGVPTILLCADRPCWRWQAKDGRTPWYDSMTVLKQDQPRQWAPVIHQAVQIIAEKVRSCTDTKAA